MPREYFLLLSSFLIAPVTAAAVEYAPQVITGEPSDTLTLSDAKAVVARSLLESGQRMVRVGHAEFDSNGNVDVEVVTIEGLPLRHVLVDGHTHQLAAVRGRSRANG